MRFTRSQRWVVQAVDGMVSFLPELKFSMHLVTVHSSFMEEISYWLPDSDS